MLRGWCGRLACRWPWRGIDERMYGYECNAAHDLLSSLQTSANLALGLDELFTVGAVRPLESNGSMHLRRAQAQHAVVNDLGVLPREQSSPPKLPNRKSNMARTESACISAIARAASSPRCVPALVRSISINDICFPFSPPSLVNIILAITLWSQCTADLSSSAS